MLYKTVGISALVGSKKKKKNGFGIFRGKLKRGKWFLLTDLVFWPFGNFFQTPNRRLKYLGYHRDYERKRDLSTKRKTKNEISVVFQNISCWKISWNDNLNLVHTIKLNKDRTRKEITYYCHEHAWKKFLKNKNKSNLSVHKYIKHQDQVELIPIMYV